MSEFELLSPVGSFEALDAALRFGADAVYLGGPFMQLRADNAGFDMPQLSVCADTIHRAGKKMYVTVNCFATNDEIERMGDYAKSLYETGVDALIVSDIGALDAIKSAVPQMDIHISTQANCQNYMAAKRYYDMGASRVVLARELSIDDIIQLREKAPKELKLEAFVHGAMCMSYSGRCLISAFLTARSGNRGECAQSCRWSYYLMEEKRKGQMLPVFEDEKGTQILSSYDLCCIDFIDKLKRAGIYSFKIEGRMKTAYYVATVTNAYRRAIDGFDGDAALLQKELDSVSHRPYSSGFYFGEAKKGCAPNGDYISECLFVASVDTDTCDGFAQITIKNKIQIGDYLEIVSPLSLGQGFTVDTIIKSNGVSGDVANLTMERIKINSPLPLKKGDLLRRRI